MREETCCFIGHRKIEATDEIFDKVKKTVEELIVTERVRTFLFGSKSEFNSLCYDVVTELKEKYPHIVRVYVRAEYPYINKDYKEYLLEFYEDTYYPETAVDAGKSVYIKRNYEMINKSSFCVIYFNNNYAPIKRKSGTRLAFEYAKKNGIKTINIY